MKPRSSRAWFAALAALAFAGIAGAPARADVPAPPPEIEGIPVAMLADIGSGQVLHARDPDTPFLPASMTKTMTAFVAFQEIAAGRLALDRPFEVRAETAREWNGKGTSMYLTAGERPSADALLRGIMTASANDASVVLAEGYAGSVEAWLAMMNEAARKLGMTRSRFGTANGWPDGGATRVSARDMVTLAGAMIGRYPRLYGRYAGTRTMVWNERTLTSHDPVTGVVPGADGIKTGHTREAGYTFLGSARRGDRRVVMVVAGAPTYTGREKASRAYLEWGFSAWKERPLFASGRAIAAARVQDGDARTVPLVARRNVYAVVPRDGAADIRLRVRYKGPLVAPIARGAQVAELEIAVPGTEPGRVPLYAGNAVGAAGPMDRLWNGLMNLIS